MGIYYNPPQPAGRTAVTPPEPHVPIGTQGDPPPLYSTAFMLVAVLASWPTDLEPRLSRPNNQQQTIAPLTLPVGQEPPRVGTSIAGRAALLTGTWPVDLEPRLSLPNNRQQSIAPLTLVYGQSPPIIGTTRASRQVLTASWPADLEPRLGLPNTRQQSIAPLTLVYGNAPPILGTTTATVAALRVGAWPDALEPRLIVPNNRQVSVAPLTLTYGQQPTPQPPLRALVQIVTAWPLSIGPVLPWSDWRPTTVVQTGPVVVVPATVNEAWTAAVVQSEAFTSSVRKAESWTASTVTSDGWTATAKKADTFTFSIVQTETWTTTE